MTGKASFFIAFRYLLGRGREGGRYLRGAAIGIALSLVPIVVTLVVADGMIQGITERYMELGTGHIQYSRQGDSNAVLLASETLRKEEGVRSASPERQGLGILVGGEGKSAAQVRAIAPRWLEDPQVGQYLEIIEGERSLREPKSAVLGVGLAEKLSVSVGDKVRLMTAKTNARGEQRPLLSTFTVSGIVSSGYRDLDGLWLFVSWEEGQKALSPESSRAFVTVKLEDSHGDLKQRANRLGELLEGRWFSSTWYDLERSQYQSFAATRQLLLFIMSLIVIVAAVNVSSSTSMLVIERRRDIAIIKSFGASARGPSWIFLLAAFLTAIVGTVLGLFIGLLISININSLIFYAELIFNAVAGFFASIFGLSWTSVDFLDPSFYLEKIPLVIDWKALVVIVMGTIFCALIAAWSPAREAERLAPLEILRKF